MSVPRHVVLRYTTLRLAIFVGVLIVLRVVVAVADIKFTGATALYVMMFALLISGAISFFALNKQRDAMSEVVSNRASRMQQRYRASAAMEDDEDDEDDDQPAAATERRVPTAKSGKAAAPSKLDV
jgi:hypothetical protein